MRLLVIKLLTQLHMVGLGTFGYMCKITLTPYLNSSSMITLSCLTTFKFLIFVLFNFSLLISTLPSRKASQIWEVVGKHDATIAILLDWLCSTFDFVINFSPSLPDHVQSKDGLGYDVKVIGSNQLHDGVLSIGRYIIRF